ncbi:MAG TPA: hypothetical protein VEL07_03980 [Planctomycetota bacterium]|nr:hypothetical protein [Planctomycetota bacterium]
MFDGGGNEAHQRDAHPASEDREHVWFMMHSVVGGDGWPDVVSLVVSGCDNKHGVQS